MTGDVQQRHHLYSKLMDQCVAFDVNSLSCSMRQPVEVMACPSSLTPEALVCQLGCSPAALVAAGILVQQEDRCEIPPGLAAAGRPLLPLRKLPEGLVFDVLTSHGTLSGQMPILAVVRDNATQHALEENGQLFAAGTIEDVITLRSWGFAATLASGLDGMNAVSFRALNNILQLPSHNKKSMPLNENEGSENDAPRLTFVGWSPSTMDTSPPVGIENLKEHWRGLGDSLDLDLESVGLWTVTARDMACLKCLRDFDDVNRLGEAVLSQVENSAEIVALPNPTPVEPSFEEARESLIAAVISNSEQNRGKASRQYRKAVVRKLATLRAACIPEEAGRRNQAEFLRSTIFESLLSLEPLVVGRLMRGGEVSSETVKLLDQFQKLLKFAGHLEEASS